MNNEIFNDLKAFVLEESTVDDVEINRETEIENDLGVYGDDADDFLIKFGKKFNVDISQFPAGDYFSDEGDIILPALIRFFTNTKKRERKSFTVGHLEKAIISGKLDASTMLE